MRRLAFVTRAELLKLLKYPLTWGLLAAVLALTLVGIRGDLHWVQEAPPETLTPLTVLPQEYQTRVTLPGTLEQVPAAFELLNVFVLLLTIVVAGMDFEWGQHSGRCSAACRPVAGCWWLAFWRWRPLRRSLCWPFG